MLPISFFRLPVFVKITLKSSFRDKPANTVNKKDDRSTYVVAHQQYSKNLSSASSSYVPKPPALASSSPACASNLTPAPPVYEGFQPIPNIIHPQFMDSSQVTPHVFFSSPPRVHREQLPSLVPPYGFYSSPCFSQSSRGICFNGSPSNFTLPYAYASPPQSPF